MEIMSQLEIAGSLVSQAWEILNAVKAEIPDGILREEIHRLARDLRDIDMDLSCIDELEDEI